MRGRHRNDAAGAHRHFRRALCAGGGKFYPEGLRQKDELAFAARQFSSIEINGTFYSLQRPQNFVAWRDATPDDFIFAVKGPRFITHMKKLKDVVAPLANFYASGLLALNAKLG